MALYYNNAYDNLFGMIVNTVIENCSGVHICISVGIQNQPK